MARKKTVELQGLVAELQNKNISIEEQVCTYRFIMYSYCFTERLYGWRQQNAFIKGNLF